MRPADSGASCEPAEDATAEAAVTSSDSKPSLTQVERAPRCDACTGDGGRGHTLRGGCMGAPCEECGEARHTHPEGHRPKMLDPFSCAGGAARGYQRAGFELYGIDIEPQPRYAGDYFCQGDAIAILRRLVAGLPVTFTHRDGHTKQMFLSDFVAAHGSPPCQAWCDLQKQSKRFYEDFIEPTRELFIASGLPYIIENVEGAPLLDPLMLCGTMFPGLRVLRHRLFESNVELTAPPHGPHPLVFTHDKRKAHHGKLDQNTSFVQVTGGGNCSIANARSAMGIDWMNKHELNEALPPAYTEYLGQQLMAVVRAREVAA